jgi:ABC-type transport system involved in multi-copper enzyme maturation permease subunit
MNLTRVLAITKYELLMHWRQRAILVLTLSLIALPIFFAFFIRNEMPAIDINILEQMGAEGRDRYARVNTASLQFFTWAVIYLILVIMAPLIMSTIIPNDRQRAVRELLDGLPITPATYLNGKLLGAWATVLSGVVLAMGIVTLVWRLIIGPLYLPSIFSAWLGGGAVLIILNTSLAILLAAGQPTRKRAFAISTALSFASLIFLVLAASNSLSADDIRWWEVLTPARSPIYRYFTYINLAEMSEGDFPTHLVDLNRVWQTIFAGLAELALVWLAARHYVQTR